MAQKISLILVTLFLQTSAYGSVPARIDLNKNESKVSFTAIGRPSFLKIRGEGAHAAGTLEAKNSNFEGQVTVDLNDFDTGIAMRDKHMKEKYLEVGQGNNSKAILQITKLAESCVLAVSATPGSCKFEGNLTFHGVTHALTGQAEIKPEGPAKLFNVEWTLKLSDYNVAVPKFAGVTVADEVVIRAEVRSEGRTL